MSDNKNLDEARQLIRDVRLIEPISDEEREAIAIRGDN